MTDPVRPVAPRMELGVLLDLLGEAACLLDDGDSAPTETLRAIYRDAVHEAMDRVRAAAPVPCAASPADPWQPIETAPRKEPALFWIIAKRDDECPDVIPEALSIFNGGPPRLQITTYGSWSSLSKATHWMPLPTPPRATGEGARDEGEIVRRAVGGDHPAHPDRDVAPDAPPVAVALDPHRRFPVIRERDAKAHPLTIPWSVAEKAYAVYSAQYGTTQSLERIAERGGFYPSELDACHPTWREESDEIAELRAELARLRGAATVRVEE